MWVTRRGLAGRVLSSPPGRAKPAVGARSRPIAFIPSARGRSQSRALREPGARTTIADQAADTARRGRTVTFSDYLRVLRERWILVVLGIALGLAGAGAHAVLATPQYATGATIFIS